MASNSILPRETMLRVVEAKEAKEEEEKEGCCLPPPQLVYSSSRPSHHLLLTSLARTMIPIDLLGGSFRHMPFSIQLTLQGSTSEDVTSALTPLKKTIERYRTYTKENIGNKTVQQDIEQVKADADGLAKKLEALETYKRKLLGEKLDECSIEELHSLEVKLERSLISIRGRKTKLLEEQVAKLREKEMKLRKDNEELREKCKNQPPLSAPLTVRAEDENPDRNINTTNDNMDVETELFIGLPGRSRSSGGAAEDSQAMSHS
uniref:K-box domain-containing protein n=1 Tax=Oryza rufipogon TaxID=4529 RepID=A0A0E0NNZ5_ORYRU